VLEPHLPSRHPPTARRARDRVARPRTPHRSSDRSGDDGESSARLTGHPPGGTLGSAGPMLRGRPNARRGGRPGWYVPRTPRRPAPLGLRRRR
jgi:hypothetical protein